jgi:site-specific DNA-methyltransferase (adenine-specific)
MAGRIIKKGTESSSFGSPGRVNHDSSKFYNSKLYDKFKIKNIDEYFEREISREILNRIYTHTSENMIELPENSIHLMVTSPPYNVGKVYDKDLTFDEYRTVLKNVWKETYRVLVPGGRAAINIANLGRKPYIPLHSYIIEDMHEIGFFMRGEIIWNKASSGSPSTAWGSWLSAKNPTLRDIHEYILIFSKDDFSRHNIHRRKDTIKKEEFLEFTKSVWTFPAVSARKIGHPAPFPIELPYRLIQLYTFQNDIVLDPFMGSGQTALASIKTKRHYIGYDIDKAYVALAEKRIREELGKKSAISLFHI